MSKNNTHLQHQQYLHEEEKPYPLYGGEEYSDLYHKFNKKDLILRDELAIARTRLAEERTQLSYIRTGLSLLLGGLFFIGYFEPGNDFYYMGYAIVIISLVFLLYGFYHHRKSMQFVNKIITAIKDAEKPYDDEKIKFQ